MKLILACIIFFNLITFSQTDKNGNPIFNSVTVAEDTLDEFILSSNYYTIHDNIDNPNSSVFVSLKPSLTEIIEFARVKPSYFFLVIKNDSIVNMVMVWSRIEDNKSKYTFFIVNPGSGIQATTPCDITGDVTEIRAAELNELYKDNSNMIYSRSGSMIKFDSVAYSIQSFDLLKAEVINIVRKYKLYRPDADFSSIK